MRGFSLRRLLGAPTQCLGIGSEYGARMMQRDDAVRVPCRAAKQIYNDLKALATSTRALDDFAGEEDYLARPETKTLEDCWSQEICEN